MTNTATTTITLYRSNSKAQESDIVKAFLATTDYSVVEKNVSNDPVHHSELIKQFGGQLSFPGISINHNHDHQFVSLELDDLERVKAYGDYWLDALLMMQDNQDETGSCGSSASDKLGNNNSNILQSSPVKNHDNNMSASSSLDWTAIDHLQPNTTTTTNYSGMIAAEHNTVTALQPRRIMQPRALSVSSAMTGVSELSLGTSSYSIWHDIPLPNGSSMTPAELTRKLLTRIQHQVVRANGKEWYYCRGAHAVQVIQELFFKSKDTTTKAAAAVKELDVIAFANMLVERSILIDWTPEINDFGSTFLVMYQYCQPLVLNTLLKWPTVESPEQDDATQLMLMLSRDMDEICIWENYQRKDKVFAALYKSLEEKICQLQVVKFPDHDTREHVTFALNLYNLMIRHAMILAPKRQWNWPTSLEEFDAFSRQIGYDVGGEIVTLKYLKESLHGTKNSKPVPLVACQPSLWERMACRGDPSELRDLHYEGPVIRTDPRVIFATTWGCHSSPTATTFYPNDLSEGLRMASEAYCQQHVIVAGNRIILPALLSWFRADFGGDSEAVVKTISRFLSPDQLAPVVELTRRGINIVVVFDDRFDWQPGISAPAKDIEFQFASKDFVSVPGFACENTVAGDSRVSRGSLVSRLSKMVMPSIPLFGRQSSDGESEVKPRMRAAGPTSGGPEEYPDDEGYFDTDHDDESAGDDYYYYDDDDATHGQETTMSALTLGSEFGDIRFQAEQKKNKYQRLTPTVVAPLPTGAAGAYGYGHGGGGGLY